jgi:hypothetical protein
MATETKFKFAVIAFVALIALALWGFFSKPDRSLDWYLNNGAARQAKIIECALDTRKRISVRDFSRSHEPISIDDECMRAIAAQHIVFGRVRPF